MTQESSKGRSDARQRLATDRETLDDPADRIAPVTHLERQRIEDDDSADPVIVHAGDADAAGASGTMQAKGSDSVSAEDGEEIQLVHLPQLEPGVPPKRKPSTSRLHNVVVDVAVELGRKPMTVREIINLKEQDVIELDKLAGESFDVRVNGRRFAWGEVVVVTDMMAVRITGLVDSVADRGERDQE